MRKTSHACIIEKAKRQNVVALKNKCKTWSWRGVAVLYTPRLGRFGRGSGTERDSMVTDRANCGSGAIVPRPVKKSIDINLNPGLRRSGIKIKIVGICGWFRPHETARSSILRSPISLLNLRRYVMVLARRHRDFLASSIAALLLALTPSTMIPL